MSTAIARKLYKVRPKMRKFANQDRYIADEVSWEEHNLNGRYTTDYLLEQYGEDYKSILIPIKYIRDGTYSVLHLVYDLEYNWSIIKE